jgi:hypothetical protein
MHVESSGVKNNCSFINSLSLAFIFVIYCFVFLATEFKRQGQLVCELVLIMSLTVSVISTKPNVPPDHTQPTFPILVPENANANDAG